MMCIYSLKNARASLHLKMTQFTQCLSVQYLYLPTSMITWSSQSQLPNHYLAAAVYCMYIHILNNKSNNCIDYHLLSMLHFLFITDFITRLQYSNYPCAHIQQTGLLVYCGAENMPWQTRQVPCLTLRDRVTHICVSKFDHHWFR